MTERPEPFDPSAEDPPAWRLSEYSQAKYSWGAERVPDALEVATLEAARRQARQMRQMSRRDRHDRPTNGRTAWRRETSC